MNNAIDLAEFLLFLKENDRRGLELSNLKLQKLLYYCEGYYLAMYDTPMFPEDIEAWKYGPVVPRVYFKYKSFGDLDIKPDNTDNLNRISLDTRRQSVAAYVWKTLGELTAGTLVDKTHSESPWLNTWFSGKDIISEDSLKSHFEKNIPENLLVSN